MHFPHLHRQVQLIPALLLALVSCGGDGGTGPAIPVATVSVSLSTTTIAVGQTTNAAATLRDASANVLTGRTVSWSSSNNDVATVTAAGIVTGVAFGSANITATAEGQSGQAALTVNVAQPTVQGLSLMQNGVALNTQNVAGGFTADFNLLLPVGYTGTVVFKLDSVEYLRQAITAPASAASRASTNAAIAGAVEPVEMLAAPVPTVEVMTTNVVTTLSAERIQNLPYHRNGSHLALIQTIPTGSTQATTVFSTTITTRNPPILVGASYMDGASALGSDGKTYFTGTTTVYPSVVVYGTETIQGFALTLTDARSEYRTPGAGLVNYLTVTRNNFDKFEVPKSAYSIERSDLTWIATSITMDNVNYDPQSAYFGNGSATADVIGSGFANTGSQVAGITPPQGMTYVWVPYTMPSIPMVNAIRLGVGKSNVDNLGPRVTMQPAFTLRDRVLTVGQQGRYPDDAFGNNNSYISTNTNLLAGLNAFRFTDMVGLDLIKTKLHYAPLPERLNLFQPQFEHGDNSTFTESSGSRNWVAGVIPGDKLGNLGMGVVLRRSPGNPWNINGSTTATPDDASFGFTNTKATITYTGNIHDNFVWNKASLGSLCWAYSVTGSLVGLPNNWIIGRAQLDGQYFFGAGPAFDEKAVLSASGGTTGGSALLFWSAVSDLAFTRLGKRHGVYKYEFNGADNAGQSFLGWMGNRSFTGVWDVTPPSLPTYTSTGTVTPGQDASATLSGTDDIAVSALRMGFRFDLPSSLFSLNKVYVPHRVIEAGSMLGGPLEKFFSLPVVQQVPTGVRFYNGSSGAIDRSGTGHRTDGITLQTEDLARNISPITVAPITNTMNVPVPVDLDRITFSSNLSTVCRGTGCSGGHSNFMELILQAYGFALLGIGPIARAEFFALSLTDRNMYSLGNDMTAIEAPVGGGRRFTYGGTIDMRNYCGPAGVVLLIAIAYAYNGLTVFKNDFSPAVTVVEPSTDTSNCTYPRVNGM